MGDTVAALPDISRCGGQVTQPPSGQRPGGRCLAVRGEVRVLTDSRGTGGSGRSRS